MFVSRDREDARSLQREFNDIERRWIAGDITIKHSDGSILNPPTTSGLYRMCYKSGKKYRRQLHKYWFVSKAGNVISLEKEGEPYCLNRTGGDRCSQFTIAKNKINKLKHNVSLSDYTLVALVYGSRIIGRAKTILDKRGLEALARVKHDDQGNTIFTEKGKRAFSYDGVSCHHIDGYDMEAVNQRKNCNPERLILITNSLHLFFDTYKADRVLAFTDVNDYEKCVNEALKYRNEQIKSIKRVGKMFRKEGLDGNINIFTPRGNHLGNIESYENMEEAKKSPHYDQVKKGYYLSEAIRLSNLLFSLGIEGPIDYPVIYEEEDKRYKDGIRQEFKIFRYRDNKFPVEVGGYYTQEQADQVYEWWVPFLYRRR